MENCPFSINLSEYEQFRTITYPGIAPNMYSVSNYGKVVRFDGYVVSQAYDNGYLKCNLVMTNGTFGSYFVHRLVAWEWVYYNRDINKSVRHIDGYNTNNYYGNLQWINTEEFIYSTPPINRINKCPFTVIVPMEEEFRPITYPGVMPGRYSISNMGKIIRFDGLEVSSYINGGYYKCHLMTPDGGQNLFLVHRLVAWEWVPKNRDFNLTVNHIDGFKTNNQYINLEWVSIQDNLKHAIDRGLNTNHVGEPTNNTLTEEEVHKICRLMENPNATYEEALKMINYKVNQDAIRAIVNGRSWTNISSQYHLKSRNQKGENHNANKLTESDVHYICRLLQDPCMPYEDIAAKLNNKVSVHAVIDIAHGRTWQYITCKYDLPHRQLKGLHAGVNHPQHRLTEDEVHFICQKIEEGCYTYKEIAKMLDNKVSHHTVFRIAAGKIWKQISAQYKFPVR